MSTAFIYPGLNGLLRRSDRERFLHLPTVRNRLTQAGSILKQDFKINIDFLHFLSAPKEHIYAIENINLAAVAICSMQTGISEALGEKVGAPDWVMGCSLGDLARSVFAGAYQFEQAIRNHIRFTRQIDGIDKIGKNIGVSSSTQSEFSDDDFLSFAKLDVDVSRLTPRFLNVGGRFADLEKLEAMAKQRGWNTMDILQYPAHSRYIRPYVDAISEQFSEISVSRPQIKIFSSFSNRELVDPDHIREEFLLSITQTIQWHLAIESLIQQKKVTRFVSVGPCRSLILMMKDIDPSIECIDALRIL